MSSHLSAQEFVDALEGALRADRQAHVDACDVCSRQIAELTRVRREAQGADAASEPSPLFWDHFSARVRAATQAEPIRALSWWERAWRPVLIGGAATAATAIAVVIFQGRSQPVVPAGPTEYAVMSEPVVDEAALELMAEIAVDASNEELESARPGRATTRAVIDELTPEQQAEFIRLIKAEIGDLQ
jgi:hypothetical protein